MKFINGLFALSFLLLGLAREPWAAGGVVLDTSGEPVLPFDEYYILPFNSASGGGLSLTNTGNTTCPVDVVKEASKVNNGMALKIVPVPKIGLVPTDTLLTISFAATPDCTQSSEWMLVEDQRWLVGIGDPEDHPGRETMKGWFEIKEHEESYKLMFCPIFTAPICGNIGIYFDENQNRRLAVTDEEDAYVVVFRKANGNSDA